MHLQQLQELFLPFSSQQVALMRAFLFLAEPMFLNGECYFHKFVFSDHTQFRALFLTCR